MQANEAADGGARAGGRARQGSESHAASRGPYRKSAARRTEILDAALAVFGRSGYRSGSLREIAQEAGITHGALLHHFGNKDRLLMAALQHRDELDRPRLPTNRGLETLLAGIDIAEYNATNPGLAQLYCVLSAEATAPGHPAHGFFVTRYTWLRSVLVEALSAMAARGQLRAGIDPELAAGSALAILDGLQLQWLLDPASVNMAASVRAYARQLTRPDAWDAAVARRGSHAGQFRPPLQ